MNKQIVTQYTRVALLDNLLRRDYLPAREFIYTVISEPLRIGSGLNLPDTRDFPANRGLEEGFSEKAFFDQCGEVDWIKAYRSIPSAAADYLAGYLSHEVLVIGYEMPPWLISLLLQSRTGFINIRISPIRFARDLYVTLCSNLEGFPRTLEKWRVPEDELHLEAGLLRASVRHNTPHRQRFSLERGFLFVGQTSADASLIDDAGQLLRVSQLADSIRDITGDAPVFYKPHPYDRRFAKNEHNELQKLLGRRVTKISENIYNLLASRHQFDVLAISSGVTQEAPYFGRGGIALFRPVSSIGMPGSDTLHLHFADLIAPELWASLLGIDRKDDSYARLPAIPESMMRRLHNSWWGYSEYVLDNDRFWRQVLIRGLRNILLKAVDRYF